LALTIDASAARYRTGVVTGLHPGLRVGSADGHFQVSARWINVRDEVGEHRTGYAALARWQVTERLTLRAGVADAPESSEGATVDVSSWTAGFDLDLSDRLVLSAGYLSEDRGAYDRKELSAGIGWRF
ncbi:MAG: YaiO family outer membrane beta-barrel protein, partial [Caulobacteraceae bacterium]